MPTKDPEKRAAKNKRYRDVHKEELNAKRREWTKTPEGKAKVRDYNAAYRAKEQAAREAGDKWAIEGGVV